MRALTRAALAAALLLASADAALAQSVEDRLRDALRRQTVDLRATQDGLAAAQAQLDAVTKQRDVLQQKLDEANAKIAQAAAAPAPPPAAPAPKQADLDQLRADADALRRQNADLQGGLAKWQAAYQQAAGIAQRQDLQSRQLAQRSQTAERTLAVCASKNERLIAEANDILHLYRTQSFHNLLLGSYEPILGLKRVELENIIQDREDRIRDQRYYPGEQPALPPGPPAAQNGTKR